MAYAADLCGSKLKAKLSSTMNEASAAPISLTSFAAKQMAKMGWKEGTGLGKNRNGIVSHIKAKKREENLGLGMEKERTRKLGVEGMWWSSNVSETLMRLQQNKSDKKKGKKSKKDKKDKDKKSKKKSKEVKTKVPKVYTDEELFIATGGARFGMRAQRRAEGKWQRTESSQHLKDWEEEVKNKIEWNGLGKAHVVLKKQDSSTSADSEEASRQKKRKRQRDCDEEEKKEDEPVSLIEGERSEVSTEEEKDVTKKEKKRRKKNKSEKKPSKKSKKKSKEKSS